MKMAEASYRSRQLAGELTRALNDASQGLPPVKIMHVCGTHEHEIGRHALRQLLPSNVELIAGPGCPVCITPASAIATAMSLARGAENAMLCTYGDIVRVPIDDGRNIWQLRSEGIDVRIVLGPREAVQMARENADRPVIFFSVGFETTAAGVASLVLGDLPDNFLIYCCHRYVPAAVEALAAQEGSAIDAYLLPGHASTITGVRAYEFLPAKYGLPSAVAGFEPVDILAALVSLLRQIRLARPEAANCYPRAVRPEGNLRAQRLIADAFRSTDASWRGIGTLPGTGLTLRENLLAHEALSRLEMDEEEAEDIRPGCLCHLVMTGRKRPADCAMFGNECAPEHPYGPCMVGGEGTCRAHYLYPENNDG